MIDKSKNDNSIHFQLYARNRDEGLVIKNLKDDNFFIATAQQILENQTWQQKFCVEELKVIEYLAKKES